MIRFKTMAALASVAGLSGQAATAKPVPCLTTTELNAVVAYMAPPVIKAAASTCQASLGNASLLATNGQAVAAQYQTVADQQWPVFRAGMLKIMANEAGMAADQCAGRSDNALRELVNVGFVAAVTGDIKPTECPKIEQVVRSLAALPAGPVTQLVASLMTLGKNSPFPLCPAA